MGEPGARTQWRTLLFQECGAGIYELAEAYSFVNLLFRYYERNNTAIDNPMRGVGEFD
jgi:hypothetical protein